jgi:hypothetical protein
VEQKHYDKSFDPFGKNEFQLFLKAVVQADDILFVKVKHTKTPYKLTQSLAELEAKNPTLEITGFTEGGEVLFKY